MPSAAAASPFKGWLPESIATMDRPKRQMAKKSGVLR